MVRSTGTVLARNALYNFLTQIIVSVVAFASIPFIVRGMGEEAFGVLTLIWMVVGYFSILDLGMGQASVKFLAEQIARGEFDAANSTVWVSVAVSAIVGLVTSLVILVLIPVFVGGIIAIPEGLQEETRRSFSLVTLAVPFVMVQGGFRALPMAVQRFDLFNLMLGLSGLLQWGGSLALILLGKGLFEVAILTVAIRVVGALAAYWIAIRLFPTLSFRRVRNARETAKSLLKFGGWLTVSQAVSPVTRYLDRMFVASYQSLKMFTYYAVPYEAISRLQVIPMSLSTTLFPAMSEREGVRGYAESFPLYMRAINVTIILMLPVSLTLIAFSKSILALWLGGDFPIMSDSVFQILAAAVFFQAVGYVPLTALQAIGRPDITTKLYLVEIPFYVLLCLALVPWLGIQGAGLAWLIRIVLSTAWLLWASYRRLNKQENSSVFVSIQRSLALNGALLVSLVLIARLVDGIGGQAVLSLVVLIAYAIGAWKYCLDSREREVAQGLVFTRLRSHS